ncbi:carboxy methyl transferase for protein phosphatase 2A [Scheffersomyces stipitis CBS 6054]|uniref:Leucine carboxyl methyltransferase 1 n=1 Tax=Scheffersomyces stipitis (strain ATCC 58785 / CBS 6054 / NBRC 10063 / NRRL Y-11545) TaxID=322104 RepID=A3GH49_PICST|nr:carboxy methyl transferase for protein phosphatase 2A [Scheffersomyces stipitis CBS 6054]EAZ62989.2 carboxy methyl transferase for protein phosphatase 2A [Scheffersomyces stipitis CBS 6054]
MLSGKEKQDKLIRATDLDALSCRLSTNASSYFSPPDVYIPNLVESYQSYLQYCVGYSSISAGRVLRSSFSRKLPLINKGTYLRTKSIDLIVEKFVEEFKTCQIISLGGGSDTRCFRILDKYRDGVTYHEIDFPESVKVKKLAIVNSDVLSNIVNFKAERVNVSSREEFQELTPSLHTDKYHLSCLDLRHISIDSNEREQVLEGIDSKIPTLVLSECVLCYMAPKENEQVLKFWKNFCKHFIAFVIYEPMSLNDSFGNTMTKNLLERGLNLLTFNHFPNLLARKEFLADECSFSRIRLTDMSNIAGYGTSNLFNPWIEPEELRRVSQLEIMDEIEEIKLLLEHYCICYSEFSENNAKTFNGIDNWSWIMAVDK